ncbi:hypothetical protein OQA88_8189 [Cercophora sp. LCS_1]
MAGNNDNTVYLTNPTNWEAWSLQFQAQAMDWTIYQANEKRYNQQADRIEKLKQWVLKTWYTALKEQTGITDDKTLHDAREAYRQAVKPLARMPKDLIRWSEQWEQAIALAQRKKVPESLATATTWFHDFLDAVKPIMGNWVTSYKVVNIQKAEQLTLTYRKVANDFREEVRQEMKARNPTSHRVIKGSFGPSFAGTTDAKEAYPGDALDSEDGSGGEEGEQKNGRKRRGGSGEGERPKKRPKKALGTAKNTPEGERLKRRPSSALGTASTTCPCCGQFHRLARCYYAFPQLAPEGFVERDHVRSRAKEALLDPKLQEEVKRLENQMKAQS